MRVRVSSSGYVTETNYIVFDIPYEHANQFTIYRDGAKLVSNEPTKGLAPFEHPTMFDMDHQTNLFRKDTMHKLMYIDKDVQKYQRYSYYVIAEHVDENGNVVSSVQSNTYSVQTQ